MKVAGATTNSWTSKTTSSTSRASSSSRNSAKAVALGDAFVRCTGRAEGDMGHGGARVDAVRPDVEARRRAVLDRPWSWLRQVHGDRVVLVASAGDRAGDVADAAVTTHADAAVCVLTADC